MCLQPCQVSSTFSPEFPSSPYVFSQVAQYLQYSTRDVSFRLTKVTRRFKRHFRPGGAKELHDEPPPVILSPAQPTSTDSVDKSDTSPGDVNLDGISPDDTSPGDTNPDNTSPEDGGPGEINLSRGLWQAAFGQLKDPGRKQLLTIQLEDIRHEKVQPTYITALDSVIGTVQNQYKTRSLKDDKKIGKAAKQILNAALGIQQYVNAIVACDPSGYASTAWSVVSLGFMVCGLLMNPWNAVLIIQKDDP